MIDAPGLEQTTNKELANELSKSILFGNENKVLEILTRSPGTLLDLIEHKNKLKLTSKGQIYYCLESAVRKSNRELVIFLLTYCKDISAYDLQSIIRSYFCTDSHIKEILTTTLNHRPKLTPHWVLESIISYLSAHDGKLGNLELSQQLFLNSPSMIKFKHGGVRHHSIIKSSSGTIFSIFRTGLLGKGKFGKVKIAQNLNTGELCAIKSMKSTPFFNCISECRNEIEALKRVNLFLDEQQDSSKRKKYIFIKLITGSKLTEFLQMISFFNIHPTPLEHLKMTRALIVATLEIMENNIFHYDLHDHNIMISTQLKMTVIDFGRSILVESDEKLSFEISMILSMLFSIGPDSFTQDILNTILNQAKVHNLKGKPMVQFMKAMIPSIDERIQMLNEAKPSTLTPLEALLEYDNSLVAKLNLFTTTHNSGDTPIEGCASSSSYLPIASRLRSKRVRNAEITSPEAKRHTGKMDHI